MDWATQDSNHADNFGAVGQSGNRDPLLESVTGIFRRIKVRSMGLYPAELSRVRVIASSRQSNPSFAVHLESDDPGA